MKLTASEIKVLAFLKHDRRGSMPSLSGIGMGLYPDKITNAQGFALMVCRPVKSLLKKRLIENYPTEGQGRYSIAYAGERALQDIGV